MKKIFENKKLIHIIIIVIGIIFISLAGFHNAMWFDESYSVAISNHNFSDIWNIGGHDVHPVLYYWILHIIRMIFGNNIMIYKLFSVLALSILGILGYTHIRKDFGENIGILFSFLVFFLPVNVIYAVQIRMYPLAMLLVTLTAIYAYRIYKNKENKNIKNWILFGVFSLASAYTHYYALAAAVMINLVMLVFLIKNALANKKFTHNLKAFIIVGIIQILAYIPWLIYLLLQAKQVSAGYWIEIKFPGTFIEMFTFQFTGNLETAIYVPNYIAITYGILICAYVIYLFIKNKSSDKDKNRPGKFAILIYGLVILGVSVASIIVGRSILYARYLLCITGLFIFFLSYILGKYGNKYFIAIICVLTLSISTYININLIIENYDSSNEKPIEYIKQNIQEGDIIVYGNEGSAFVVSANFPDVKQYFWDQAYWQVDEAFKAYGPNMEIIHDLEVLKNYKGRIWVINTTNYAIATSLQDELGADIIEKEEFKTAYEDYEYTIALVNLE